MRLHALVKMKLRELVHSVTLAQIDGDIYAAIYVHTRGRSVCLLTGAFAPIAPKLH